MLLAGLSPNSLWAAVHSDRSGGGRGNGARRVITNEAEAEAFTSQLAARR